MLNKSPLILLAAPKLAVHVKDSPSAMAGLTGGCGYIRVLRQVFPQGNRDAIASLLQEAADAYIKEYDHQPPPQPRK